MQWNPGDGSGIIDEVDSICDSSSTSYPIAAKTRRGNMALDELVMAILTADGTWQFDDPNYTDLPNATFTFVEGQFSYSFTQEFLRISKVFVLNAGGKWWPIKPRDQVDTIVPLETYYAMSGLPIFYDKEGDTIKFGPAPSATALTLVNGGKIEFQRTMKRISTGDTTLVPGIMSTFHVLLAKMIALPYCKTYKKDRVPALVTDIAQGKIDLVGAYSRREKDVRPKMTMRTKRFR